MERILFICSTKYLLFNALHVRMHMFAETTADIIVDFRDDETEDYYRRVKETGVFENVAYLKPKWEGIHEYIRSVRKGKVTTSLKECVKNTLIHAYERLSYKDDPGLALQNLLYGAEAFDFSSYTRIFGQGNNETVKNIAHLVRSRKIECELNALEEGDSTYIVGDICRGVESDNIYVYIPELVLYKSNKLKRIAPIDKDDLSFVGKVNYIFGYKQGRRDISNKIILFDTYAEQMPKYLTEHIWLSKSILRNAYKKHKEEDDLYNRQRMIFKSLLQYKGREIFIKLHPSTKRCSARREFNSPNVKVIENPKIPWEVYCLNNNIENNIFIATLTAALKSNRIINNGIDKNKYVVVVSDLKMEGFAEDILKLYRRWDEVRNDGNMYYPESINEYEYILKALNEEM